MEELIVYAILCCVGYKKYDEYKEKLDQLFLQNPQNEVLLDLEGRNYKDAMLHLFSLFNEKSLDLDIGLFSVMLMSKLKDIYTTEKNLKEFGKRMYQLWQYLPDELAKLEPFSILCYADDPLSWGDKKQCRELYEKAIYYYDKQ